MILCRLIDKEVELGARYTACSSWVRKSTSEKCLDSGLRHEAKNATAWQCEFGHSWHVESRRFAENCGVEAGALLLAPDVEDEVGLHGMGGEDAFCVA